MNNNNTYQPWHPSYGRSNTGDSANSAYSQNSEGSQNQEQTQSFNFNSQFGNRDPSPSNGNVSRPAPAYNLYNLLYATHEYQEDPSTHLLQIPASYHNRSNLNQSFDGQTFEMNNLYQGYNQVLTDSQSIYYGDKQESVTIACNEDLTLSYNDWQSNDERTPFGEDGHETYNSRLPTQNSKTQLVLDCPVATNLLEKLPEYNEDANGFGFSREFAYMRYTAVTCGPSNFVSENYRLRQMDFNPPRSTEIMVVVTMYNEDDTLLGRTLRGIQKNMKHLVSKTNNATWGENSWQKVVVCIVSDGRSKINERAQALLAGLGVYQEGLAKSLVDDRKVRAHVYEYTTKIAVSNVSNTVQISANNNVPTQMLFLLKEFNEKKINSHRWCFQALAQVLNPEVVILLDAGTEPSEKSFYKLWKEFYNDEQVAGACGEIQVMLNGKQILTNPLVCAQNFEYKISNILDKPMESAFGFISVLPGAFSAYRFSALKNGIDGTGPLEKYFKGEFLHRNEEIDDDDDEKELKLREMKKKAGIFISNMYLAEDRSLCYELVAKRGCNFVLRYVKSASAVTDVPGSLAEFVLQRRRWLNGSFFAATYSLTHFHQIWYTSHSFGRKIALHVEFIYQLVNLVISWFSLSSYFLVFRILSTSLAEPDLSFAPGKAFSLIFLWLYLTSLVTTFVLSFGNKPKGTEKFYTVIVVFFGILMAYMIFAAIFMAAHSIHEIRKQESISFALFFHNTEFRDLVVATVSTYLLYFFASFLYLDPLHMFTSFLQYILLSPSYVNVLNIYAFCNIDDISWGTKGDTGAKELGVAKTNNNGLFDIDIPILKEEINNSFERQLEILKVPLPKEKPSKPTNSDYYAYVRSMTVLAWMISNFIIVALILETGGFNMVNDNSSIIRDTRSQIFLTVILWTVAFMALFRFGGCVWYLCSRLIRRRRPMNKV